MTNIVKDISATFAINDGRLFIRPFDTKLGNIKLNVSGDQGLDQTLNFIVRTEIPRSELGDAAGALMGALAAQAATMGINLTPPDIIKVNLKIGGTFLKPVITPSFAGSEGVSPVTTVTEAVKEEVTETVNEEARAQADKILKEAEEQAKVSSGRSCLISKGNTSRSRPAGEEAHQRMLNRKAPLPLWRQRKVRKPLTRRLIREPPSWRQKQMPGQTSCLLMQRQRLTSC